VDASGSLRDGNYELTIYPTKARDTDGMELDGDQDGTAGGEFSFGADQADAFFRHYGDRDGDRDVDFVDFFWFRGTFGKRDGDDGFDPQLDFDGDGDVDFADFFQFRSRFGNTLDFE
jgi:hypothetical protein